MSWLISAGYKGAAVSDADAQTYLRAVEAADGQALEPAVARAVNEFVIGCKQDGIWTAIKASCILAGARTLSGALVPLVGAAPTRQGTANGWNYNRKTGLSGNGTDNYINSNRKVNESTQNSFHLAVWLNTIGSTGKIYIGALTASSPLNVSQLNVTSQNNLTGFINSGTGAQEIAASAPSFLGISRSASSSFTLRAVGANYATSDTSIAPGAVDVFIFARSQSESPISISNSRISFYCIGDALTLSLLDARVTTLINALGAAIP